MSPIPSIKTPLHTPKLHTQRPQINLEKRITLKTPTILIRSRGPTENKTRVIIITDISPLKTRDYPLINLAHKAARPRAIAAPISRGVIINNKAKLCRCISGALRSSLYIWRRDSPNRASPSRARKVKSIAGIARIDNDDNNCNFGRTKAAGGRALSTEADERRSVAAADASRNAERKCVYKRARRRARRCNDWWRKTGDAAGSARVVRRVFNIEVAETTGMVTVFTVFIVIFISKFVMFCLC